MIFCFSATGNSLYVAQRIAEVCGDSVRRMDECLNADQCAFELPENEPVGIVTPVYAWRLPSVTEAFLKRLSIAPAAKRYTYLVVTYGTTTGGTGYFANKLLPLDARFCVKMPDTWTPTFDLSDPKKVAAINERAEARIDEVAVAVAARKTGDHLRMKTTPLAIAGSGVIYENMRKTAHLHVETCCVGCGLCAKKCPVHAIEMRGKRPVWVVERCAMCLGCLHRCPKFAIQYENRTQKHGQYNNPHVRQ